MRNLLILLAIFMLPTGVLAQSKTVMGTSKAQRCYEDTKFSEGANSATLRICSEALRENHLGKRDRARTLVNRGIQYSRTGDHQAAMADYEEALVLWPDLPEAYLNRGNTHIFQKKFDLAIADYDKAIEFDLREMHAAYFNRGLAYEALKKYKLAYEDFKNAAASEPGWAVPAERVILYQKRFGYDA